MAIGLRKFFRKAADQAVAASTTLVDCTDLAIPVAVGQKVHLRMFIPFTVGATGGFKFQLVDPGSSNFRVSFTAIDGVTAAPGSQVSIVQAVSAAFANAWAVAGTHQMIIEGEVIVTTAGSLKLQMACNSAANSITVLKGASIDVTIL